MPLPSVSFLVGLLVLGYLSTFVIFALIRIVTGVSIQRVGYAGFRRITFSPSDGIKFAIRGVAFSVHRPTFAQPTWISLNIYEPQIILDLRALSAANGKKRRDSSTSAPQNGAPKSPATNPASKGAAAGGPGSGSGSGSGSGPWQKLTEVKEKIKRLHRHINWLRLCDTAVLGSTIIIQDIGTFRVERFTLSVDTRAKAVDRSRLFQHDKARVARQGPAEWKSMVRTVFFTPEGGDSMEILDFATFSVYGFLHSYLEGLRDASVALKFGRVTVPYDDIVATMEKVKHSRLKKKTPLRAAVKPPSIAINDVVEEPLDHESRDDRIVQTVHDSREFVSSILRGIQEIQLQVGSFGLSKQIKSLRTADRHVHFNLAMKEVGLDLLRLDSRSPAHRQYFSPADVAHQALLTAISISAGIDDGHEHPERMLYVPMVTATVKTTLPSKTINVSEDSDAKERNSNILFANFVCTSPSVDLDPKNLPLLLAIAKAQEVKHEARASHHPPILTRHGLLSRLLPKSNVKLAIQEPVIRVSLPPLNPSFGSDADFDLLISTTSTMALDIESQHTIEASEPKYGVTLKYRQSSQQLYYQTNMGEKHDLMVTDIMEVNVDVNALPEMQVFITARFQTFSVFLVRTEISEGIREIMMSLQNDAKPKPPKPLKAQKPSFLRKVPAWLQHVSFRASDLTLELAGVDALVSKYARGFALNVDTWSAEYKAHRDDTFVPMHRRRSLSRSVSRSVSRERGDRPESPGDHRRKQALPSDGRRLAVHFEGVEGLIIDSVEGSTSDPFLALPKFEVAFSTSSDAQGPLFHINSQAKNFELQYSLYYHFSIGVAVLTARRMFVVSADSPPDLAQETHAPSEPVAEHNPVAIDAVPFDEVTTVDFKANLLQIKGTMPSDPPLMIQIFGIDAGHHRWATPFVRCKVARLYAGTPRMRSVWSRIVSIRFLRLEQRETRRKVRKQTVVEKSIDVSADAVRLSVPHGLVLHNMFDNIVNVIKSTEQMHHHFKTGSDEYILTKHPEGAKNVPRISIRTQVLIFVLEDSPFEWKLGCIYRAGLNEQQQRLARAEAFRIKTKRMEDKDQRRGNSRLRAQSAQPGQRNSSRSRPPSATSAHATRRKSVHATVREESPDTGHGHGRGRKMRYDAGGKCNMSGQSYRSVEKAYEKLQEFNSQSWKNRIDRSLYSQQHVIKDLQKLLWGGDDFPEEADQHEPVMGIPQRPGLLSVVVSDLGIIIDKPSFAREELPQFLHDIGKGMPKDMQYGLLVPMSLKISMGEARCTLRDYPLPLLHVPAIRSGQTPRLPSLSVSTDFVVAEEFQGIESQRHVYVTLVPPDKLGKDDLEKRFTIDVRRTVSPVKTYSNMKVEINTSAPTRITWGTSYQPAIQDMMQVIENFTKPPMDPSERVGFWDKIRLSFHSRIDVEWKGDGDVHLNLKGSRDPYVVTGRGAGFVMVWRNNVRWRLAQDPDPRKLMTVDSGDYILAIPDFNHYARTVAEDDETLNGGSSTSSSKANAAFKKVVMKLSGNVQWLAGLMFERDTDSGRSFHFKPHYEVVLKHPDYAVAPEGQTYDAFRNFRSQHIHLSIGVSAPQDRDWNVSNLKPSQNYNSVHLTPRAFTHFFDWWSMFSGVMSLPVRQGPLWGTMEKSSKKFGRHLGSIKYNLLFSPLFLSHIYKHKDAEDYSSDEVSVTGLKMKLDSFMLDMHQRRENFEIPGHGDAKPKMTSQMKINQCQLDFISADIRAISASLGGTSYKDIDEADDELIASLQAGLGTTEKVDMSKFTIPDNDFTWIDMDDFVELDWTLPAESNPETKILPLAFAPRFTYFRQTDHGDSVSGDTTRSSPFGDEPTHFCVMSKQNDPRRVQADLIQDRLHHIEEQIANNERAVNEQELKVVQDVSGDDKLAVRLEALKNHTAALQKKHEFLGEMLRTLIERLEHDDPALVPHLETVDEFTEQNTNEFDPHSMRVDSIPLGDYTSDFNNRFVVHNAQIKWNNSLRNIILRYIHQVGQRRGFVYYMSRRAVKFILDVLDERKKPGSSASNDEQDEDPLPTMPLTPEQEDEATINDRIAELLSDGKSFVNADDPDRPHTGPAGADAEDGRDLSPEYVPQNTYHFRLIAPQIQLQSEKNSKAVVLVAAKGMQLKVVNIMDKHRVLDDISGLVQARFSAAMDSLQIFVTSTKTFSTDYLHMYSGNRYGGKTGEYWPPWVPLEVMFEFHNNPYGFSRVVHRTSATMRYDKYNTLRLKYHDDVTGEEGKHDKHPDAAAENRMDHIWVEFPQVRAICDSAQYFSIYIIVLDLLLYSEPLEKTRSERLEKIMLASDFSDLTGAPEMVEMLQTRIRQLEDIKMHFQVNEKYLDRQGWKDRIAVDQDLASCEDELFFMMKAITTSQQRIEDRDTESSTGLLRWLISSKEIAWHLIRDKDESLLEFQLKDSLFDRTDNNDGSNYNCVEIGRINGFNLLPNAVYPEIIAPYVDAARGLPKQQDIKMLRVQWLMLEAIAGIPVVDYFEVNVMPLRIQLEREIAKRLFEYIFPGVGGNAFEGRGFSPFMIKNMVPQGGEDSDEGDENDTSAESDFKKNNGSTVNFSREGSVHQGVGTGTGDLEHRLHPTMKLSERPRSSKSTKSGLGLHYGGSNTSFHWNPFGQSDKSQIALAKRQAQQADVSSPNLSIISRSPSDRSLPRSTGPAEKKKDDDTASKSEKRRAKDDKATADDLTQMLTRASNYMTLAFFKIPSVVLCLSYKGRGTRNIEDVHDLVFRLPTLEYRNKTWSNLDLALQIKKDLMKALISHAGAIVGNKFSHRRPGRQQEARERLREIANFSTLLAPSEQTSDDAASSRDDISERPRPSFNSDGSMRPDTASLMRSTSHGSDYSLDTRSFAPSIMSSQDVSTSTSTHHSFWHSRSGGGNNGGLSARPGTSATMASAPLPNTSSSERPVTSASSRSQGGHLMPHDMPPPPPLHYTGQRQQKQPQQQQQQQHARAPSVPDTPVPSAARADDPPTPPRPRTDYANGATAWGGNPHATGASNAAGIPMVPGTTVSMSGHNGSTADREKERDREKELRMRSVSLGGKLEKLGHRLSRVTSESLGSASSTAAASNSGAGSPGGANAGSGGAGSGSGEDISRSQSLVASLLGVGGSGGGAGEHSPTTSSGLAHTQTGEEGEEGGRKKNRLLLGGQKLLGRLPHKE